MKHDLACRYAIKNGHVVLPKVLIEKMEKDNNKAQISQHKRPH